ncbi:hypothetical protein BG015_008293 [Linnemannia schmuckeri]|uniref:Uncharacterized protein n=1 Tax=Linnemannia schmuckeri TaxID=64567 RepID=A0A9P5RZQ0_9FUNG|nr:hypothetical protein BG015_008293 [Linnemannia schmuckeri]
MPTRLLGMDQRLYFYDLTLRRFVTIDYDTQPRFVDLSLNIVAKHGRHIRIVENVKSLRQVTVLANASVVRLRELQIETTNSARPPALVPYFSALNGAASKFKHLRFSELCLTCDGLVTILQASPQLYDLTLIRTEVVGSVTQSFQHSSVKHLSASIKCLSQGYPAGPSLLTNSSSLTKLNTWLDEPKLTIQRPSSRRISLGGGGLESFSRKLLQLIPKGCLQLEILDLKIPEMSIDEVEMGNWACKGLETLSIKIKGLDTKEKICKAIDLRRAGCKKQRQEKENEEMEEVEEETKKARIPAAVMRLDGMDLSIEARVARHLLKFVELETVWLGYKSWTSA